MAGSISEVKSKYNEGEYELYIFIFHDLNVLSPGWLSQLF